MFRELLSKFVENQHRHVDFEQVNTWQALVNAFCQELTTSQDLHLSTDISMLPEASSGFLNEHLRRFTYEFVSYIDDNHAKECALFIMPVLLMGEGKPVLSVDDKQRLEQAITAEIGDVNLVLSDTLSGYDDLPWTAVQRQAVTLDLLSVSAEVGESLLPPSPLKSGTYKQHHLRFIVGAITEGPNFDRVLSDVEPVEITTATQDVFCDVFQKTGFAGGQVLCIGNPYKAVVAGLASYFACLCDCMLEDVVNLQIDRGETGPIGESVAIHWCIDDKFNLNVETVDRPERRTVSLTFPLPNHSFIGNDLQLLLDIWLASMTEFTAPHDVTLAHVAKGLPH